MGMLVGITTHLPIAAPWVYNPLFFILLIQLTIMAIVEFYFKTRQASSWPKKSFFPMYLWPWLLAYSSHRTSEILGSGQVKLLEIRPLVSRWGSRPCRPVLLYLRGRSPSPNGRQCHSGSWTLFGGVPGGDFSVHSNFHYC